MSSKGLKRPLELDSVPDVQPLSDSDDDLSSPECLLSLQPVEDDYSSDDEARKKEKRTCLRKIRNKKQNRNQKTDETSLLQVIEGFHINFLKMDKKRITLNTLQKLDMKGVLASLLSFLSKTPVSASDAIKQVLSLPTGRSGEKMNLERHMFLLKLLLHYNSYEFPDEYDGCLGDIKDYRNRFEEAWLDMRKLIGRIEDFNKLVSNTKEHQQDLKQQDKSKQHDIVKIFFSKFCECFAEEIKYSGEVTIKLQLMPLPERIRVRQREKGETESTDRAYIQSKPDLMMMHDYSLPPIPFEVFSPLKWKKVKRDSPHRMKEYESTSEDDDSADEGESDASDTSEEISSSSECGSYLEVTKFLKINMPCDFKDDLPTGKNGDFRKKCTTQLLTHLLGCTEKFFKAGFFEKSAVRKLDSIHTAIGIFAFHFNLYIVKLEGYVKDFWKLFMNDLDWHNNCGKCFNVTMYPLPLYCTNPSVGIAVMFFLKYYREVLGSPLGLT